MGDTTDLRSFLSETEICDHSAAIIVDTAVDLCSSLASPREQAVAVYHFVRDEVTFRFSPFEDTASDTLRKKAGHCFQKASLQIALLRSLGIPAGYRYQQISPDVFRTFVVEEGIAYMGVPLWHAHGCVLLDGQWIDADLTFDRQLIDICFDEPWSMGEEWNGFDNRMMPDRYLIGDPSDVQQGNGALPHDSDATIEMLNRKLVEMREDRGRG